MIYREKENEKKDAVKLEGCHTIDLFIIADDFTGALDTGVQMAARGAKTRVLMDSAGDLSLTAQNVQVLVMDTETRHLSPEQAAGIVRRAVSQAVSLGIRFIYKKTDSALRGNIGAELEAVMKETGIKQLPFLPAFPKMGRVTRNGKHYIDGIPVHESVFGRDPFEPVRHAEVEKVIGEQSSAPVISLPAGAASEIPGILVYDAVSDEDLRKSGEVLRKTDKLSVTAGCAGFGAVLSDLLVTEGSKPSLPCLAGPFLILCGSVNPITLAQIRALEEKGAAHLRMSPAGKLTPGYFSRKEGKAEMDRMRSALAQNDCVVIDANDADGNRSTLRLAEAHGLTQEEVRTRIAANLGLIMAGLTDHPAPGTVLITGGDTLRECMKAIGIHEMEPLGELFPGVVISRFSHCGHPRYIISKSGGFGEPDLLVKIAGIVSKTERSGLRTEKSLSCTEGGRINE